MERKWLSRWQWPRVTRREDIPLRLDSGFFTGYLHLLRILEVQKPLVNKKFDCEETVYLAADGYTWLLLMPDGEDYVLTAQYDDCGGLVQIYADVTAGRGVDVYGPFYDDLYADVLLFRDGRVMIDDLDELEEARRNGDITPGQESLARRTAGELASSMGRDPGKWFSLCDQCLKQFQP